MSAPLFVRYPVSSAASENRTQIFQGRNESGRIDLLYGAAARDALRGGDARGLAGSHATGHHAQRGECLTVGRQAAAGHEQVRVVRSDKGR